MMDMERHEWAQEPSDRPRWWIGCTWYRKSRNQGWPLDFSPETQTFVGNIYWDEEGWRRSGSKEEKMVTPGSKWLGLGPTALEEAPTHNVPCHSAGHVTALPKTYLSLFNTIETKYWAWSLKCFVVWAHLQSPDSSPSTSYTQSNLFLLLSLFLCHSTLFAFPWICLPLLTPFSLSTHCPTLERPSLFIHLLNSIQLNSKLILLLSSLPGFLQAELGVFSNRGSMVLICSTGSDCLGSNPDYMTKPPGVPQGQRQQLNQLCTTRKGPGLCLAHSRYLELRMNECCLVKILYRGMKDFLHCSC